MTTPRWSANCSRRSDSDSICRTSIALRRSTQFLGLTEGEIIVGFRQLAATYLSSDYHPTYIQRRLGPNGFLEVAGDRYRFRSPLVQEIPNQGQLEELLSELVLSLKTAAEHRQEILTRIQDTNCVAERATGGETQACG